MSSREEGLAVSASPWRALSLLTVRAAISSATSLLSPRSRSPSFTCSYWRSRFCDQASWGMDPTSSSLSEPVFPSVEAVKQSRSGLREHDRRVVAGDQVHVGRLLVAVVELGRLLDLLPREVHVRLSSGRI